MCTPPLVLPGLMTSSVLPSRMQSPVTALSEAAHRHFVIEHDDIKSQSTHPYRLFVASPRDIAEHEKRPVLYLLDANAQFPLAVNSYTPDQGPAPVIVGIGYRIEHGYDIPARTRDYTPPALIPDPDFGEGGGAEHFYHFINNHVKPWVASRFPVETTAQTLAGHSFGGLFVLYTLFNHGEAFQHYLAASPSLWWGEGVVIPKRTPLLTFRPGSITLSAGEYEEKPASASDGYHVDPGRAQRRAKRNMVTNTRDLAQRITAEHVPARFILYPGKNHGSVIPDAMAEAVKITIQS